MNKKLIKRQMVLELSEDIHKKLEWNPFVNPGGIFWAKLWEKLGVKLSETFWTQLTEQLKQVLNEQKID
jgi:hypothetical protein